MPNAQQQTDPAGRYRIRCAEIWGGIRNAKQDVCSGGVIASLYSSSADGDKGGDIYYLSVCASDLLTRVTVADVMGHGLAVAEVSQFIYDSLKSHMNDASGDQVLSEVNRAIAGRGLQGMTTAAVAAFHQGNSNLYFAYAGHLPVLVKRGTDRRWFKAVVESPGGVQSADWADIPLAVTPEAVFTQQCMPLSSGDRLFLYTDGITEAPDASGDEFGEDRLMTVLEQHGTAPLRRLRDVVLDSVRSHTGGHLSHDDVTLMVVEIR